MLKPLQEKNLMTLFFYDNIVNTMNYLPRKNNQKLILRGILMKVILLTRNNILV
jgi:hypothetical protein